MPVLMTKVADVRETALQRGPGHEPREHNSDAMISTGRVLAVQRGITRPPS